MVVVVADPVLEAAGWMRRRRPLSVRVPRASYTA
jgi:hypothetical protein